MNYKIQTTISLEIFKTFLNISEEQAKDIIKYKLFKTILFELSEKLIEEKIDISNNFKEDFKNISLEFQLITKDENDKILLELDNILLKLKNAYNPLGLQEQITNLKKHFE
jgi:hypothetical protein